MPETPWKLGDFTILRRIGSGGMAEVFVAEKQGAEGTSKRLVVKRILPGHGTDPRLYAMFVREARLATRLGHPNVVHVYELVEHPTHGLLLAMEHVEGADLGRVLQDAKRRNAPLPPYVAALIARDVAKGLHYAHEKRDEDGTPIEIVHRDVSPQNILVSRDGVVKIADLGIATARLYRDATTGLKGKFRYMAPEQAAGAVVDRRADVYALGVVLYEMLRLASPYGVRTDEALLRSVRNGRFEPAFDAIDDVPADLLAVLRRALARDPAGRYPTARDFADDLSRALLAQQKVIDETAIEALIAAVPEAPPAAPPGDDEAKTVAAVPQPRALDAGATIGRYVIEGRLGRGGMADVYAARDTTLARMVALKVLRGTMRREARDNLLREARLAATLEHPGSVVVYDVGEEAGVGFIAMELVRGKPLLGFIGDRDIPIARRIRWLVSAARAIAAAHDVGLIHRDIKPSNLMIREGGEVKVLDYGIARSASAPPSGSSEPPSTAEGAITGTLRYAAPERFAGEAVDGRADQFSWGVTAWELLAGRPPFASDDTVDSVGQMLLDGIGPLAAAAPEVPDEVATAVDRALSKRPEDRFDSMHDVADVLEPYAEVVTTRQTARSIADIGHGDPQVSVPPPPLLPPAPAPVAMRAARPRWRYAAAAGLLVLGAVTLQRAVRPAASTTAAEPQLAAVVGAIACSDAVVDGDGADLARAVGVGACARLATEIGAEWAVAGAAQRLEVEAKLRPGLASVTLRIAGREATASGSAPIVAVRGAVAKLAPALRTPPWSADRVRLWGARDELAAQRILRVWRLANLSLSTDLASEIKQLIETDGDSPIPHLLALMTSAGGKEAIDGAPARIEARLGRVSPARAAAIRGILLAFPAERDRKEAVRLFREAYAAAPDDHSMAALYAALGARLGLPEAHAVLERLHAQAPTYCVGALGNAVTRAVDRDDARSARYVAWIEETLPEAASRVPSVTFLASVGRFDDARAALARAARFGLEGAAADPLQHAAARAEIELGALAPAAARAHAGELLADPRFAATARGGTVLVASYMQEARLDDAEAAMRQHAVRQRDQGNLGEAVFFSLPALRLARWLDRPAPDPLHAALLERIVAERADVPLHFHLQIRAELALTRRGPDAAEARKEALRALEEAADRDADGEPMPRDRALVLGLALTRAVRGDRAAVALWQRTTSAPHLARRAAALDAALALEAVGDDAGAEAAYLKAAETTNNLEDAGQRVLAIARLALLHRRLGKSTDAAAEDAILDGLWGARRDGLREAVKRMR